MGRAAASPVAADSLPAWCILAPRCMQRFSTTPRVWCIIPAPEGWQDPRGRSTARRPIDRSPDSCRKPVARPTSAGGGMC